MTEDSDLTTDEGTEGEGQDDVSASLQRLEGRLDEFMQAQQADDDYDDYDYGYEEDPQQAQQAQPGQQQQLDPEQADQQAIERYIAEQATAAAKQTVEPWMQQQQEIQRERDVQELLGRYPDLKDVAKEVDEEAMQRAQALGQPELAFEASFLEMTYLARKARDQAQADRDAGAEGSQVTVEGGQGAIPNTGGGSQADDLRDRIAGVSAARNSLLMG